MRRESLRDSGSTDPHQRAPCRWLPSQSHRRREVIRAAFALAMALVLIQDNGWHFADEDQDIPSWTQELKDQAPEMALFAAFATLAMVSFFRKSEALKYVTMGVSIVYLGFMRSELITVVNI